MIKLLIIDNYDSFTHNLAHLFGQLADVEVTVVRNDDDFIPMLEASQFDGVIISPGPGNPQDKQYFGKNMEVINRFGKNGLPILGICLGFQGIAVCFGAGLKQASLPQHGKTSQLKIINQGRLLAGISEGTAVMRYHSLMIDTDKLLPDELNILAETAADSPSVAANGREIMAFEHKDYPIFGVQFHPESYGTKSGGIIANNFLKVIKD